MKTTIIVRESRKSVRTVKRIVDCDKGFARLTPRQIELMRGNPVKVIARDSTPTVAALVGFSAGVAVAELTRSRETQTALVPSDRLEAAYRAGFFEGQAVTQRANEGRLSLQRAMLASVSVLLFCGGFGWVCGLVYVFVRFLFPGGVR